MKNEEQLRSTAADILKKKCSESSIINKENEENVPKFDPAEVDDDAFLGSGTFCTVTEVSQIYLTGSSQSSTQSDPADLTVQDREFISRNCDRNGQARYAIKRLSNRFLSGSEERMFVYGVVDLAMELKYLSIIQHPHIIKMRGCSTSHPCSDSFFVILDRLHDTLGNRIQTWKKATKKMSGLRGFKDLKGTKKEEQLGHRLLVAYNICSALSYLHQNSMIYRDIKPENIGFDVRDDVKVFDFGLATEMQPSKRVKDTNTYNLTAECGSPRYMAPEVAHGRPYNHKVDVYSFAVLLWEICALKTPYDGHNLESLDSCVWSGDERPPINAKWTKSLKGIMTNCWSHKASQRNECGEIMRVLKNEIIDIAYGDDDLVGSLDISNQTELSALAKVQ